MKDSNEIETSNQKYKDFNETFKYCTFGLAMGLLYPNRSNVRKRQFYCVVVVLINGFTLFWFCMYLYKCITIVDLYNLSNNITIGVLITIFFFKLIYCNYKTEEFAVLLEKISSDLLKANELAEDYQEIYDDYIRQAKVGQMLWLLIPVLVSSQFPIYAGCGLIYITFKNDAMDRRGYMVHEMQLKFLEDKQYETPYFEIMFAYTCIQCITLAPNFAGFDGSFCIATTHLRMKLHIMLHNLRKCFKEAKDSSDIRRKLKSTVMEHQEAVAFYEELQDIYGSWLLTIFLLTSLLISMNIYQLYLSDHINAKYTMFGISSVLHMFAPCYYASTLTKYSEDLSSEIYSVPWEVDMDPWVIRILTFMITKSQQRMILTGNGMVVYNMELFISIMQTSYSLFTLITMT